MPDPTTATARSRRRGRRAADPRVPAHTVVVPPTSQMVTLLGPARRAAAHDRAGRSRSSTIHVRGNEFTLTGPSAEVALVERLIDELLAVIEARPAADRDAVERSIGMLRAADRPSARPTC